MGKGTGIAFRERLSVQHGPNIFVDCVKDPEELTIRDLTIHDGDSRAAITLNLKNKVVDLTFVGALTETTLDKILAKSLTSQAWAARGFQVSFCHRSASSFLGSRTPRRKRSSVAMERHATAQDRQGFHGRAREPPQGGLGCC